MREQPGLDLRHAEQSAELREVGAAVALAANATLLLRDLGLGDSLARVSSEPTRMVHGDIAFSAVSATFAYPDGGLAERHRRVVGPSRQGEPVLGDLVGYIDPGEVEAGVDQLLQPVLLGGRDDAVAGVGRRMIQSVCGPAYALGSSNRGAMPRYLMSTPA